MSTPKKPIVPAEKPIKTLTEDPDERERLALSLLVKEIMSQLDLLAYLKSCGFKPGISAKVFHETCSPLAELSSESLTKYFQIAIDLFERADLPPKRVQQQSSANQNKARQAKLEEQLLAAIQNKTKKVG